MLFLLAVFAIFLIAGIVLSYMNDGDSIYIALGFLLGLLAVVAFIGCSVSKNPISTTKHDYKLQSYIPYNDEGSYYEFFTIDENNSLIDCKQIPKSNVRTVLSAEREYEIKVTVEHYKKTPILGTFMPEIYGGKDIISNVILFLPAATR